MKKIILATIICISSNLPSYAEDMENMEHQHSMSASTSANAPMQRKGSGTSWLPDSSPMYAYYLEKNPFSFMFHGNAHFRYNNQNPLNPTLRSGSKFDVPNWVMAMAQTPINQKDRLTFTGMFSLDAFTVGGQGYPLLFQTGETYQGKRLVDSQHPHDLFSELSLTYVRTIDKDSNIFAYFGLPGEPAIGPTAFMHRISSFNNPDSPLGHHWQDATHITFGVITLGGVYKNFKLDASAFTGREPDENRLNFDTARFDSYSGRITYNPTDDLSVQASYGYIKSPEALEPNEDAHKVTASVTHNKVFNNNLDDYTNLASTFVWGMNGHKHNNEPLKAENSFLLESELQLWRKNFFYTRIEYVQKSANELNININESNSFNISALTFGYSRTLVSYQNTLLNAGTQVSFYLPDSRLEQYYGKNPLAFQVYLRITPDLMVMNQKTNNQNMEHDKHEHNHSDMNHEINEKKQEHNEHSGHENMEHPTIKDEPKSTETKTEEVKKENNSEKKDEQPQKTNTEDHNMHHHH